MAGFGHLTGVDLPHETTGIMPSPQWKMRYYRQKWYLGETPSVGIGQGAVTVTPLQLTRALAGLAMGGVWHRPRLVASQPDKVVEWKLNPDNVKAVRDGMYGVVNEGGTGVRARLPNVAVCGKTGTAQLSSEDFAKASGRKTSEDDAWFEAFAPCDNPEIVVVAFLEKFPGHGQFAAPIVRDIMKAYFDKKVRLETLDHQKQAVQERMATMSGVGLPGPATGIGGQGSGAGTQGPGAGGQGTGTPASPAVAAPAAPPAEPAKVPKSDPVSQRLSRQQDEPTSRTPAPGARPQAPSEVPGPRPPAPHD
jgi:penicillin-binding protein 2